MENNGKLVYQLNVKLTEEMRDQIKQVVDIERRPQSWIIRDVLEKWLKDYFKDKN